MPTVAAGPRARWAESGNASSTRRLPASQIVGPVRTFLSRSASRPTRSRRRSPERNAAQRPVSIAPKRLERLAAAERFVLRRPAAPGRLRGLRGAAAELLPPRRQLPPVSLERVRPARALPEAGPIPGIFRQQALSTPHDDPRGARRLDRKIPNRVSDRGFELLEKLSLSPRFRGEYDAHCQHQRTACHSSLHGPDSLCSRLVVSAVSLAATLLTWQTASRNQHALRLFSEISFGPANRRSDVSSVGSPTRSRRPPRRPEVAPHLRNATGLQAKLMTPIPIAGIMQRCSA